MAKKDRNVSHKLSLLDPVHGIAREAWKWYHITPFFIHPWILDLSIMVRG